MKGLVGADGFRVCKVRAPVLGQIKGKDAELIFNLFGLDIRSLPCR